MEDSILAPKQKITREQLLEIEAGKFLLIRLEENISELDEVQVIAYGTQRKHPSQTTHQTVSSHLRVRTQIIKGPYFNLSLIHI